MNTWIALIRGINVGGKNIVKMAALREAIREEGFSAVQTYIQSGNIVLRDEVKRSEDVKGRLLGILEEHFGVSANVVVISTQDLEAAIQHNPFPDAVDQPKTLHCLFLASEAAEPDMASIEKVKRASERYHLTNDVFYLHAPDGIARSKLAATAERLLGVDVTARNWNTVIKLMSMADNPA